MSDTAMTIPKTLHYIWVGPKPVPDQVRAYIDGWQRLNPDFTIQLWNEDNLDFSSRFMQTAYGLRAWNRISDFARMAVLLRHGGIYLDTDIELRRPLTPLLENHCFLGFQLQTPHPDWVNGAVLGAVPGHWFIQSLYDYFLEHMGGWEDVGSFYGPGLITKMLLEAGLRTYANEPQTVGDVTVYPTRWFYPCAWTERFSEHLVTSDTYAIHHWDESWAKNRTLAGRLRALGLKLAVRTAPSLAYRRTRARVRRQQLAV